MDCIRQKRLENKNKRNAYNREWYKNNKERAAEYQRVHRSSDRAKARGLVLKRRARILENGVYLVSKKELKNFMQAHVFIADAKEKLKLTM